MDAPSLAGRLIDKLHSLTWHDRRTAPLPSCLPCMVSKLLTLLESLRATTKYKRAILAE